MSEPTTTRRNALRTIAATVGVTTVGAGALYGIDEAMGAHVSGTYTFTDPTAILNDTGDLKYVSVVASTDIQWTGFEVPVTHVGFSEVVSFYDASGSTLLLGPKVYWGQDLDGGAPLFGDHAEPRALSTHVGNDSGPYALDETRDDHDPGTTGSIQSGGTNVQVLLAEDQAAYDDAAGDSAIETEAFMGDDATLEPDADGETLTTLVRKTEYAHLYTDGPELIHPSNDYDWAPTPAVVTGTFDVVVENRESDTSDSTGDGTGESG